jgi:hypothetical protein
VCDIYERIERSVLRFIERDYKLLVSDANEDSISARIAQNMEPEFPEWDIDTQYNRFGIGIKTKLINISKEKFLEYRRRGIAPNFRISIEELYGNPESAPVFPDIIVHKRNEEFNNHLVMEVKKLNNPELFNGWDEWKIHFFMHTLNYRNGVHLILKSGYQYDDPNQYIHQIGIWP